MSNHNPERIPPLANLRHLLGALALLATLSVGAGPVSAQPTAEPVVITMARGELLTWLNRGPQYLLSQLIPVPVVEERRFKGYRLTAWFPSHPEVTAGPIRPGDVIKRIHGRSIERPDQYLYLWKRLRGEDSFDVTGTRDGEPFTVTFKIVTPPAPAEAAPAAAPPPAPASPAAPTAPTPPREPAPDKRR
jgi:hypothetical protein